MEQKGGTLHTSAMRASAGKGAESEEWDHILKGRHAAHLGGEGFSGDRC